MEELNKCLNDTWDFLEFTTEGEDDFADGFLPMLDFATWVLQDGYIQYKFYNKPMATNLVLQFGTALADGCIFSSLRQDLIRRLLNTDLSLGIQYRVSVVEQYIQLLVNSGHRFSFIKSIVLQGLTKYVYMVSRSQLDQRNNKYSPLHRGRSYKSEERRLAKYSSMATWYTDTDYKDRFRNVWKRWIVRKNFDKRRVKRKHDINGGTKRTTTAIFVPKTDKGELAKSMQTREDILSGKSDWKVKILEKPGVPLQMHKDLP